MCTCVFVWVAVVMCVFAGPSMVRQKLFTCFYAVFLHCISIIFDIKYVHLMKLLPYI